jgi:uncharacterized repeat protein (TIGR01451 family)
MHFETLGRRLAKAMALLTLATMGLAVGVPSGAAGFGRSLESLSDREPVVADLTVTASDSADPVQPGQNFHYNIRIRNQGPDNATGVRLVNGLPESFQLISWTGAKSCTRDGALYCELDDIPHNGSLTVVLHVEATTPGLFWDTSTVSATTDDPDNDNNSARESTEVKGTVQDPPPGQQSHLTVIEHVTNDNGGAAKASDFALAVKGGSPNPAQFPGADSPGTEVTLDAGSYAVSQETALGYWTTFSQDCEGTLAPGESKTCTVSSDDLGPITLGLSADRSSVEAGVTTGYTATLTNPNAVSVAVSSVNVTLAGDFSYKGGSTSGAITADPQVGSGGGSSQSLTWQGPVGIPGNGSASFHFTVTAPAAPGDYRAVVAGTVDAPFTVVGTTATAPVTVVEPSGSGGSTSSGSGSGSGSTQGQTTTTTTSTSPTPLPPPEFQKDADVEPVSGDVFIRLAGTTDFVPLKAGMQAPFGSEVDATDGRVALSTVDANGTLYHADFYEGRFLIKQQLVSGITVLRLSGSDFKSCKTVKRTLASVDKKPKKPKKAKSKKRTKSKTVVRHLWASGTGKFRTTGRYIAATVHGTSWLTQDRCDGTRAYVQEGVVDVRDLVKHKTIRLGAGQSYLGRPGH